MAAVSLCLFSRVGAGAFSSSHRLPTASSSSTRLPSVSASTRRRRRSPTTQAQQNITSLPPSSAFLAVSAVANANHYIREDYLVKKVTSKELQELLKGERSVPLVIDFYATWCGPCILMAQDLEMLAVEYESNALFVKVDTDDEYEFARDMQVRGLPTLYFISPNPSKDAIRTEGLVPPEMIKNIIDNEM